MSRVTFRHEILFLALVLGLLLTAGAQAALFTVTLTNGTTFDTRERPVEAEWDENYVMLRTDRGNWIALHKDEVADVSSDNEATGFGYQLDSTTLFVGWTPGDIVIDEEGAEGEGGQGNNPPPPPDNTPISYGSTPSYSLDQFLDIPADGNLAGGVSLGGAGGDSNN